ncbi:MULTISPECIES: HAD hydrolase-like protein [unclassified Symbiopectobacterium]|uniref:HAD hydrolase-like protein n=1 Tax=unclassified Symbiopectobacterium TaxID=2794573 RepID=UPI002226AEC2|nr:MULTISPECIES: HAD hydrolase-like protein [unclassified Symbiopectobacterium]MCW2473986.1 HAD hydrolase-like protein [Candidatus Symbiopectobacterium sp. NZEC151]MCW2482659.1 HAD hydrolase-like protein [Candidatus Symbiopectobacterium sp. NZEC135]
MNVIFDMDGTLVDSVPGIRASLAYALEQQGHRMAEETDITALIGPPMDQIVATLLAPFGDDRVAQTVALYREHYGRVGLLQGLMYPGIEPVLQTLHAEGHRLFIATSKRQPFAERIVARIGISALFDDILGTPLDGSMDDKRLLVAHLVGKQGLPPSISVMVGDRKEDIVSAQHNHLLSIGARWGYGSLQELVSSGADRLCQSPADLLPAIHALATTSAR